MVHVTVPSASQPPSAAGPASPAGAPLARLARDTTPTNPWPLRLLSSKIDDYVARMTYVWVEGQVCLLYTSPSPRD